MSYFEFQKFLSDLLTGYLNSSYFLLTITIAFAVIGTIAFYFINKSRKSKIISISDISAFSITIKLNMKNIDIAHKMYIHLRTRKIGIPFDENDVLIEVYKSWYTAFNAIRDLLLEVRPIPQNIVINKLGINILNEGMRPHLTKWQAKFKKWYDLEVNKTENSNLSPQEIQRNFPEYNELINDLKRSQKEILSFLDSLEKIIT